jgi:hypothetical protein
VYTTLLIIHSWLRWLAYAAGVVALVGTLARTDPRVSSSSRRDPAGLIFTIAMDVQLLVGIALYGWLSPITTAAFHDFSGAMRNASLRFWAVEHPVAMIGAVVAAHVGGILQKRGRYGRFRGISLSYAIALILMAIATPWPGRVSGRPLLRFGS